MDMKLLAGRRRVIAALTATAVIGGGSLALAANPAPESYAFIARGDNPVDALAAAPLAGKLDAPVILTEPTVLTEAARRSLIEAEPDIVWIAGGTTAISPQVESSIRSLLPDAEIARASGDTRYDTSEALAKQVSRLAPSYLMRDGKANAAEIADVAKDAQQFGGLAPDEYQFTQAHREGSVEEFTFTGSNDTRDVLPPLSVDAPADGMLHVDVLADGPFETVMALVDFEGDVYDGGGNIRTAVFDHLAAAFAPSAGGMLRVPVRVDAGQHTVRLVAVADDGTIPVGLRSLSVHYTAGVSGQWEDFEIPAVTTGTMSDLLDTRE